MRYQKEIVHLERRRTKQWEANVYDSWSYGRRGIKIVKFREYFETNEQAHSAADAEIRKLKEFDRAKKAKQC